MLPRSQWLAHREEWLERANLTHYSRPAPTLVVLNEKLNALFASTNKELTINAQMYFDAAGDWHMHRYRAAEPDGMSPSRLLYPINRPGRFLWFKQGLAYNFVIFFAPLDDHIDLMDDRAACAVATKVLP